jgi:hypothetical protein
MEQCMSTKRKTIRAAAKPKQVIAMSAPVTITAAESDGEKQGPAKFDATFYTGGALEINGWDLPVVVDLAGLSNGNVLVANLDHDSSKRVGNFAVANDGKTLVAHGTATAKTAAREEVVGSAAEGYQWQASLEVNPKEVEEVKAKKSVTVNGQEFTGPLYVTRKGTLKGFAFVSHGADDNTTVSIAAIAANHKENDMDPKFVEWLEAMLPGTDVDHLSAESLAKLQANFAGEEGPKVKAKPKAKKNRFDELTADADRHEEIMAYAENLCTKRKYERDYIQSVRQLAEQAIDDGWSVDKFRLEALEASLAVGGPSNISTRDRGLSDRVLQAALCKAGGLSETDEKGRMYFTDQEMQTAHDKFPHGISLNQFLILCAEANGYRGNTGGRVTLDVQRAAFGMAGNRQIHGSGFSTIDVANITGAVANKFIHEGWMAVDQTALRIAAIKNVRNFQTHTTVSLTGALQFEKLGPAGEIKNGTLDEITYTNQADTYAAMLAITRQDIINDDLGALTAVPRRLGRGGMLKLNDIFWTEFLILETDGFFAAGNNNLLDGVATLTLEGLTRAEALFLNQTDYDGKPLGLEPAIVLVPTALKAQGVALLDPQGKMITGASSTLPDANPYRGRFRLESSPYMSNSAYTGFSAAEWYLMADPNVLATIEIAALNGRVEPTVDTADADFNTLGIQMRGYSDIGVKRQEKKAAVLADGGAS